MRGAGCGSGGAIDAAATGTEMVCPSDTTDVVRGGGGGAGFFFKKENEKKKPDQCHQTRNNRNQLMGTLRARVDGSVLLS